MIFELLRFKKTKKYKKWQLTNEFKTKELQKAIKNLDFELFTDPKITQTTKGELVLFYKSVQEYINEPITFYVQGINEFGSQVLSIHFVIQEDFMKIIDVKVLGKHNFNKGYGTLLIQKAIEFTKGKNIKRICGTIVSDSDEHYQRQLAFYEKNGFTILEDGVHFEMICSI